MLSKRYVFPIMFALIVFVIILGGMIAVYKAISENMAADAAKEAIMSMSPAEKVFVAQRPLHGIITEIPKNFLQQDGDYFTIYVKPMDLIVARRIKDFYGDKVPVIVPKWMIYQRERLQISGTLGQEKGKYRNIKHPGYHLSPELWEGDVITFYSFHFDRTNGIFMMGSWKN